MDTVAPIPSGLAMRVLLVSTLAFAVCFAAWMMFGVTGIPIRKELGLNASQFGLLTATPVLTGALFRLPLGIWTDRFGGRIVMFILLVVCAVPLWLSSYATELWQFLLLGLALGLVGASFAVGTPYTSRFFPKEKKGLAMGVFGAGTTGAAINMFVAPPLLAAYGWQSVPRVYAVTLLITAALFWLLSAPDPGRSGNAVPIRQQLAVLRDPRVWKYCQYYSLVFGGFTAISIWMPQYFVNEYHFPINQAALMAASFSLPAGVLRALGGYLSDRFGAHTSPGGCSGLDLPVPAVISADRFRGPDYPRAGDIPSGFALLELCDAAVRTRRRLGLRHGIDLQIYQR
jgi:MFS transporter, NNP family, nitrate/nitrite transporter